MFESGNFKSELNQFQLLQVYDPYQLLQPFRSLQWSNIWAELEWDKIENGNEQILSERNQSHKSYIQNEKGIQINKNGFQFENEQAMKKHQSHRIKFEKENGSGASPIFWNIQHDCHVMPFASLRPIQF